MCSDPSFCSFSDPDFLLLFTPELPCQFLQLGDVSLYYLESALGAVVVVRAADVDLQAAISWR